MSFVSISLNYIIILICFCTNFTPLSIQNILQIRVVYKFFESFTKFNISEVSKISNRQCFPKTLVFFRSKTYSKN
ncbi:hypothetical protein ANTPLA_LOCUS4895 [Anthophora plagiata]